MKNKAVLLGMAALLMGSATFAQENDDMYFTSKDRAKLKAKQAQEEASYSATVGKAYGKGNKRAEDDFNTTDSYSARNENPEFAARSNSQTATSDNQDYFVNGYQYTNNSNLNNFNNNYSNWSNSSMYSSNYYRPSIYGMNRPYYAGYYDAWGSPLMNPYYGSGWSSGFSLSFGNSWNYGWGGFGMGYGMGYGYGNPYYNSWSNWGSSYGYGMNYGFGGYGGGWNNYPGNIVIINNNGDNGRNVAYGKRGSHSGMVTTQPDGINSRTRPTSVGSSNGEPGVRPSFGNTGGRVSTEGRTPSSVSNGNVRSRQQEDYYDRSWRNSQQQGSSFSAPSRSSSNNSWNQPSHYNNGSNNNGSNNNGGGSNSTFNNSGRSSGGFDGGTRSHSSGGGGSGSGGRTRGRD